MDNIFFAVIAFCAKWRRDRTGTGDPRLDEAGDAGGPVGPDLGTRPACKPRSRVCKNVGVPRNRLSQGHLQRPPYTKGIPVDSLLLAVLALCWRGLQPPPQRAVSVHIGPNPITVGAGEVRVHPPEP
jgi:hypothetical protein